MRLAIIVFAIIGLIQALPSSDFISGESNKEEVPKVVEVPKRNDFLKYYSSAPPNSTFYIQETDTFISPKLKSNSDVKILDTSSEEDEFVEFYYTDKKKYSYKGMIPISSCLYQDYGGSVAMGYTLLGGVYSEFDAGTGISIGALGVLVSLSFSFAIEVRHKAELTGTVTCNVNEGTWGQVMLVPGYLSATPYTRTLKLGKKKIINKGKWVKEKVVWEVLKKEIHCVTSNKVELQCYGFQKDMSLLVEDED